MSGGLAGSRGLHLPDVDDVVQREEHVQPLREDPHAATLERPAETSWQSSMREPSRRAMLTCRPSSAFSWSIRGLGMATSSIPVSQCSTCTRWRRDARGRNANVTMSHPTGGRSFPLPGQLSPMRTLHRWTLRQPAADVRPPPNGRCVCPATLQPPRYGAAHNRTVEPARRRLVRSRTGHTVRLARLHRT